MYTIRQHRIRYCDIAIYRLQTLETTVPLVAHHLLPNFIEQRGCYVLIVTDREESRLVDLLSLLHPSSSSS